MVFEVFQNFAPVNKKGKETRAKNIFIMPVQCAQTDTIQN